MPATETTTQTRPTNSLRPHPLQPRLKLDTKSREFQDLLLSVRRRGIIEPLVITPAGEILAGLRRHTAARLAPLKEVPVHVRVLGAREHAADIMLDENGVRQSLSPLEEAQALESIRAFHNFSNAKLARHRRESTSNINQLLAILSLEEQVRLMYHRNELPLGAAQLLGRASSIDRQLQLAAMLRGQRMSLEELRGIIKSEASEPARFARPAKGAAKKPAARAKRPHDKNPPKDTPLITRQTTLAALAENGGKKIPVHTIAVIFEQTCCNCGLAEFESTCSKCPLLRFTSAILGRSS